MRFSAVSGSAANFRIVSAEPSAAVGEASVDHRARLVDASSDPRHDLVDRAAQVALVVELRVCTDEPTLLLQPDVVVSVDHHLGHVLVAQERLDRSVAQDVIADLLGDPGPFLVADRALVSRKEVGQDRTDPLVQLVLVHVGGVEVGAELLEQLGVHGLLQLVELVPTGAQ
jgi:hypothetical protein